MTLEEVFVVGATIPVEIGAPLVGTCGCPSGMTVTIAAAVVPETADAEMLAEAVTVGAVVSLEAPDVGAVNVTPTDAQSCWANTSVSVPKD